jgi:hypothetical protein
MGIYSTFGKILSYGEKAVFLVQRRSALPSAVTERCVYSTSLSPAVFSTYGVTVILSCLFATFLQIAL